MATLEATNFKANFEINNSLNLQHQTHTNTNPSSLSNTHKFLFFLTHRDTNEKLIISLATKPLRITQSHGFSPSQPPTFPLSPIQIQRQIKPSPKPISFTSKTPFSLPHIFFLSPCFHCTTCTAHHTTRQ